MARSTLVCVALLAVAAGVIAAAWLFIPQGQEPARSSRELFLERVREHSAFRRTVEEPLPPEWLAAEPIATGELQGADLQGVGKVSILQAGAERRVVLQRYDVDFAPGLHVVLMKAWSPTLAGDVLDLGELHHAAGGQSFLVPSDVRLEEFQAVGVRDPELSVLVVRARLSFRR